MQDADRVPAAGEVQPVADQSQGPNQPLNQDGKTRTTRDAQAERLERKARENPSAHGEQSTPRQQHEIAESEEHDGDRARARIDPKALSELKD